MDATNFIAALSDRTSKISISCSPVRAMRTASTMLLALTSLLAVRAHAMNPEIEWKATSPTGSPTYTTKAAAVAWMQSQTGKDARYPLLTIERRISATSEADETYEYEAPKIAPTVSEYDDYQNVSIGGPHFASESETLTYTLSQVSSASQCPAKSGSPAGAWYTLTTTYGGVVKQEQRAYTIRRYTYHTPAGQSPYCEQHESENTFRRTRSVTCPVGYGGETPAPGCFIPLTAKIQGTRNYNACPVDSKKRTPRGNPCDPVTGNKSETVEEYAGPFGLGLTRYYQSRSLDATNLLGVGWSHNYQSRVILNAAGAPLAISRGGFREALVTVSTPTTHYVSKGRVGAVVRKISTSLYKVALNDGTVESYDGTGRLISIVDPAGRLTSLAYTGEQLTSATGPFGHALLFEYNASGYLARVRLPDTNTIEYSYTGSNLTGVLYPNSTSRTYHYENASLPNHLTGVTDESATRLSTFQYDTMGRPTLTERAGGVGRYTFVYNATNSVVTDPLNTVETISFTNETSNQRRVTSFAKPGQTYSYSIPSANTDAQRRPTQITDERGILTSYVYSTYAVTQKTEAVGTPRARTTSFQYLNSDSDRPTLVTEPNRTTAYTYDANGNWLTRTITNTANGATRVWTRTVDGYGRVLTEDGPRTDVSDVTTYTYYTCTTGYQCGQLNTVTNALNQTTTYTSYNAHGQPLSITDPNGVATTLTYDLRQRVLSRTTAGETTTFEYWPTGLIKKVIQPDASFILYSYDAAQRLNRIEDNLGNRIDYTLDNMGNRTAENAYDPSNSLRRTHSRVFNALNQFWKDVNAAGTPAVTTVFGYDANGNPTTVNAPLGRNTTNAYDELNRVSSVTDPASGLTSFGYDANDNLTSVTDPRNLVTSYTYNGFGDPLTLVSPDTGTTTNTYDSAGNLATSTDSRTAVATYSYDAENRVTQVAYGDQTIAFGYDAGTNGKGRITSASDATHSMSWTYDAQGRVTGKGQTVGAVTLSVGYGYTNGRHVTTTLPSGQVITYGHDAAGRIASISVGATGILSGVLYEPFGPVRQWTWGNSALTARTYDTDYKVTQVDSGQFRTYAYDDAFRITGITDSVNPNLSWTYGYDGLDRLTSATSTPTTRGWTYDANGNRLTETGSAPSTYSYTVPPNNNRITAISGALPRTYSYDAAGNALGFGGATFTYNNRNRMATASFGGSTASYVYNALGERVRRTVATVSTHYVYDEAGHLIGEYDGTGALIQETVWMGDTPVATLRPNGGGGVNVFYVHTDHLDTPRLVTQPSNNAVRWRWDSDPFGTNLPNENPTGLGAFIYNLRFPGQQYDGVTGLHYNYFRDYDASTGRYVESDPIGLDGGINTYSYVGMQPTMLDDPTGEFIPAAVAYARCVTQCLALDAAIAGVNGDACFDLTGAATSCAVDCLNPLNWFKAAGILRMAQNNKHLRKVISGLESRVREHQEKLRAAPDSVYANHWRKEIRAWRQRIERLQRRL